jgi:glycosyltransferase involved in cell wall biosynthesis
VTQPRRTKSRNSGVPLYSIDSRSGRLKQRYERTPKISIVTDAADISSIPRAIFDLTGEERRVDREFPQLSKSRARPEAALIWFANERLLEGTARGLLKSLHASNRRTFVVVQIPCVTDVPFLTVQPRIFTEAASVDYRNFRIRIESEATPDIKLMVGANRSLEPWAMLVEAISSERAMRGSGAGPLLSLWESREKLPDIIGALALRNLAAVMLLHQEAGNAQKFLQAGVKLYPTYAELHYLLALLAIREQRFGDALPLLERAKSCGVTYPGSGGENTYRCDWLLGVLAAQVSNGRVALERLLTGVKQSPLFEPALTELLKLDLPRSVIESLEHVFARVARQNPHVAPKIFEYLLGHRSFEPARRIARASTVSDVILEDLENRLETAIAGGGGLAQVSGIAPSYSPHSKPAHGVVFEGPFLEHSSLARVNREVARGLQASNSFEVSIEPSSPSGHPARFLSNGSSVTEYLHKHLQRIDLTVRHQWPPDFRRPPTGKLAVILPWEYGAVPQVWIEQIERNVDELWVPSNFVRGVFVRNGVESKRVVVIPNGYDPAIFNRNGRSLRPQGSRDCIFLFVGGAIERKGVDLLLDAMRSAFTPTANVTLALLISGSSVAYQHNSLIAEIRAAASDPTLPHILPIFETVDDMTLAELYRAASALVLPYRGEGFGMPLLEAMACAKPVITTREGPATDFCDESNSYLIPATEAPVPDQPPPLGPMVGDFTWFEPDFAELVRILGRVYEDRIEAAEKGLAAAQAIRNLTWENVANQYAARIRNLCG